MTRPVFLLRPEPGWSASAAAARDIGLEVTGEPLSSVVSVPWSAPTPGGIDKPDGLLVGSANVFRHGGAGLDALRHLPIHCVGETTAQAARAAGFAVETTGKGGLSGVLETLKGRRLRLLRLCGEARIPLDPPEGIAIEERVVYRLEHRAIGPELAAKLEKGGVVLLHSAELARHFASECSRLEVPRGALEPVLIGPRLAPAVGSGWHAVHIADRPDDATLLALVAQMCSKAG